MLPQDPALAMLGQHLNQLQRWAWSFQTSAPSIWRDPPEKDDITFDHCLYKVQSSQNFYPEKVLRHGIIQSLKGKAAELVRYIGQEASIAHIIKKLQDQYREVASSRYPSTGFLPDHPREDWEKYKPLWLNLMEASTEFTFVSPTWS